jgi:hypothetical protein
MLPRPSSLFAVLPLVAILSAGCASADPAPTGASDDAELREGGVCATLDYGHAVPNADYFLQFADDAAIMSYATGFLAANGKPAPTSVSSDARLVKLVNDVYAGFKKVFPRETAGLEVAPRIVIVDAQDINAFAGYDDRPEVKKAPWLFFVHQSIIDRAMGDTQLRGLFAHELAHLILRNVLPETRAKIRVHYRVRDGKENGVLGAMEDDDKGVAERAARIHHLGEKVGRVAALGPLAIGLFSEPEYQYALGGLKAQRESSAHPEACAASDAALAQVSALIGPKTSAEEYSVSLTAAESAQITKLATEIATHARSCYGHVKGSLYELKVRGRFGNLPPEIAGPKLKALLDPKSPEYAETHAEVMTDDIEKKLDADDGKTPTVDRLFTVVETMRAELSALESDKSMPVDELRIFDDEEDADDAAVRVLRAIDDDPHGIAGFLTTILATPEACAASIQAGKIPAYGRFIDEHNATCWRIYHVDQMAKALARCTEAPPRARAAKGSGVPSTDDKPATELLEKGHQRSGADVPR